MTKKKIALIAVIVVIFLIFFCPVAYLSPFAGKVIDAETKEPVEDAIVLAVYWKEVPTIVAGSNIYPADLQETITDRNGEFKIPQKTRWFGKAKRWPDANITIFKPGYGTFPKHQRSKAIGENKTWPSPRKYIVYEISQLKTFKERKKNITSARRYDEIPYERWKFYFKAINKEIKNLGLSLYPFPEEGLKK